MNTTTADFLNATNTLPAVGLFARQYETMEEVWNKCPRPDWMLWILDQLGKSPSEKELRLFACWCARSTPIGGGRTTWDLITDPRSRAAIEVAERFAVGEASEEDRHTAYVAAWTVADNEGSSPSEAAAAWTVVPSMSTTVADKVSYAAAWAAAHASPAGETFMSLAHIAQANRLQEMVGNPFMRRR